MWREAAGKKKRWNSQGFFILQTTHKTYDMTDGRLICKHFTIGESAQISVFNLKCSTGFTAHLPYK